jgi:hypothetical protein
MDRPFDVAARASASSRRPTFAIADSYLLIGCGCGPRSFVESGRRAIDVNAVTRTMATVAKATPRIRVERAFRLGGGMTYGPRDYRTPLPSVLQANGAARLGAAPNSWSF